MSRWDAAQAEADAALAGVLAEQPVEVRDVLGPATRGGKRLRPCVLLLVHDAHGGGARAVALRHAVAVELVHTATLIHDDIVDDDWTRRGRPATRGVLRDALRGRAGARRPDALAALAGDACLALAMGLVQEPEASARVAAALLAAWRGAWREALGEQGGEVARGKTAVLFRLAAELGACGAGADPAAAGDFGETLGLAYQAADDAADAGGDAAHAVRLAERARDLAQGLPAGAARDALAAAPLRIVRAALPLEEAP
ncbi:MAG: polyprenyl synthetase family protein [Halobacteriales archaeon]|nr:polyprenyl synthetase family protein [Halobacteriales archaeon]